MTKAELLEKNVLLEKELKRTRDALADCLNELEESCDIFDELYEGHKELISYINYLESTIEKMREVIPELISLENESESLINQLISSEKQKKMEIRQSVTSLLDNYKKILRKYTKASEIKQQNTKDFWDHYRDQYDELLKNNPDMKPADAKYNIGKRIEVETGKKPHRTTLNRQFVTNRK